MPRRETPQASSPTQEAEGSEAGAVGGEKEKKKKKKKKFLIF